MLVRFKQSLHLMNTAFTASVTTVMHERIDRVWKALLDPADIAKYMMGAQVDTDWQEGSPITWKGEWQGKSFEDHGRVLKVREPDLLKYSHTGPDGSEHIVTIELKETAGSTHLRLSQDNNPTAKAKEHAEANWTTMLDGLKKLLGEAPVPPPEEMRV